MEIKDDIARGSRNAKGQLKHFISAFLLASVGYFVLFHFIEGARVANSPWRVTFTNDILGKPLLVVQQDEIVRESSRICFPNEVSKVSTNSEIMTFERPRTVPFPVPFGRCIFLDTTFLPGTVVFELFGHTVELMPRALIIDQQEHKWRKGVNEVQVGKWSVNEN